MRGWNPWQSSILVVGLWSHCPKTKAAEIKTISSQHSQRLRLWELGHEEVSGCHTIASTTCMFVYTHTCTNILLEPNLITVFQIATFSSHTIKMTEIQLSSVFQNHLKNFNLTKSCEDHRYNWKTWKLNLSINAKPVWDNHVNLLFFLWAEEHSGAHRMKNRSCHTQQCWVTSRYFNWLPFLSVTVVELCLS